MDTRKIWLTGSSGLAGRAISARLAEQKFDVLSVTNQTVANYPEKDEATALGFKSRQYVDYSQAGQIEDSCSRFGVPEILIHSGWGGISEPESQIHLNENVADSLTLMRTLYRLGLKKFVFLGTINEYGQRDGRLSEEMEPVGKLRNYEAGKRKVGELGIEEAEKRGAIYIHIRVANLFGAPQRIGSLISTLHQAYNSGESAQLSECGDYRDYIHTSDMADGILSICGIESSTTVNLGSGTSILLRDFVESYWESLGGDRDKLIFGSLQQRKHDHEQLRVFMDISKLAELTQWRPASTIQEGITQTVSDMSSYWRRLC